MQMIQPATTTTQPLQGPTPQQQPQEAEQFGRSTAQQQRSSPPGPAPRQHPQQAQQRAQQQRQPLQGPTPQQHPQQTQQGGLPAAQQHPPGYRPYVESPNSGRQQAQSGEHSTAQQQHQQGHGPHTAIPIPSQEQATEIPTPGREQGQARADTQRGGYDGHRTLPPSGSMSQRGGVFQHGRGSQRRRERERGGDSWPPPRRLK